jgi:hypothetical protein
MLSKPMRENVLNRDTHLSNISNTSNKDVSIINYKDFYKNNTMLQKYKLPELKKIVKHYKLILPQYKLIITNDKHELKITGNKDDLIMRIETLFNKMKNAEIIQKRFRGWIVRYSIILNGEAVKNRSLCVNDSDFVTLEPLDEIPRELFYSYKDAKDFHYGFNITSLIQMMKTKGKINNPYNREAFDTKTLKNMISLYSIIQLIYPEHKDENNKVNLTVTTNFNTNSLRNLATTALQRNITQRIIDRQNQLEYLNNLNSINRTQTGQNATAEPQSDNATSNSVRQSSLDITLSNRYYEPTMNNPTLLANSIIRANYNKIVEMRRKPIDTRIQELFMEIDQLGNYTQSSWFSNLNRREYILLWGHLRDIWRYRAQLSFEIKNKICPLFDPFSEIFTQPIYQSNILEEQIKLASLTIIENLVYSGIDDESKYLGSQHALTALTIVSDDARQAMPWLYESVAF